VYYEIMPYGWSLNIRVGGAVGDAAGELSEGFGLYPQESQGGILFCLISFWKSF
jgi:hypothetical protein